MVARDITYEQLSRFGKPGAKPIRGASELTYPHLCADRETMHIITYGSDALMSSPQRLGNTKMVPNAPKMPGALFIMHRQIT